MELKYIQRVGFQLKRLVIGSLVGMLFLTACGNEEQDETGNGQQDTGSQEEVKNNNVENEEINNQQEEDAEADNNEEEQSNNMTEQDGREDREVEINDEASDETDKDTSSQEATNTKNTYFDINSKTVQDELFNIDDTNGNNLTFSQDVITEGMTQTEIEDLYGEYDLIYPGHGRPIVVYGNLGVSYSESFPYGTDDEQAREDINPDENRVEDVFFYAGLPYEEVISAVGTPDTDVYETTGGPVSGLLLMEYNIDEQENTIIKGQFHLHENENGELMVDIFQINEEPLSDETLETNEPDVSSYDKETINSFIEAYIDNLMDYYNNGNEDALLTMTPKDSPNFQKLERNKESDNFSNHKTYSLEVLDISEELGEYSVTVEREYSHASSNGREKTQVVYTIFNTTNGFRVFDYEE